MAKKGPENPEASVRAQQRGESGIDRGIALFSRRIRLILQGF
jgi:hypothetical protein